MTEIDPGRRPRYLLDTSVISETRKKRANKRVMQFIASLGSPIIFVSVLTFGELRRGAIQLDERQPANKAQLTGWIEELQLLFAARTLPVDVRIANLWGLLSSDRSRAPIDTLLAATAIAHNLTLVTRNVVHFEDLPVTLINPWEV